MFPRRGFFRRAPPRTASRPELQEDNRFYPGVYDVLKVRHILLWKVAREGIPAEVVDMIVDAAEYWPSVEVRMENWANIRKDVDEALVMTRPLCYDEKTLDTPSPRLLPHRTVHPCRQIVFRILSHDQGGGGQPNPYEGSMTWFDTEIIHNAHEPTQKEAANAKLHPEVKHVGDYGPDDPLLLPRARKLQSNRARQTEAFEHTIVWDYLDDIDGDSPEAAEIERARGRGRATLDGKQVREMEIGDSIMVWGRSRFPGWVNHVEQLAIRVFWAI